LFPLTVFGSVCHCLLRAATVGYRKTCGCLQCTNPAISFDCVGVEEVAHVMEGDPLLHYSYVKTWFICI
jgi:hypothetical protein